LINYKSFREIFNNFFAVLEFDANWNAIRFSSCWDEKCAGGWPDLKKPQATYGKFLTNP